MHLVMLLSFFTLALTGMTLKFSYAGWAVLLQNHGLLVAGRSLRRAADLAEIIERSSELILGCYAVGKEPPVLPEDAAAANPMRCPPSHPPAVSP